MVAVARVQSVSTGRQEGAGVSSPTMLMRPALNFSTQSLAAAEQFALWQHCNAGMGDVTRAAGAPTEGFSSSGTLWRFGSFALGEGSSDAFHYQRTPQHIRRDSIDHWVISVITRGSRLFQADGIAVNNCPGAAVITSLDRPFETEFDPSQWVQLYVPRDAFAELGPALDTARYQRQNTPLGRLLSEYLELLIAKLPRGLEMDDAPRLAEATRAMIAACVKPSADGLQEAMPQIDLVQLSRIKRLIRRDLALARLGPEQLCRNGGVSRSKLYRFFEPYGGVAKFIQGERLRRAHAALSDPSETRSVGLIAESVGLFDLSTFGRMFRLNFGCSPRELRGAAAGGMVVGFVARPAGQSRSSPLGEMLRAL